MSVMAFLIVFVVTLIITTVVLAGVLALMGVGFDQDVLLKCLGINATVLVFSLIPFIGMLAGVVWIVAVMTVFEKSFLEALLVAMACWAVMLIVSLGMGAITGGSVERESPPLVVHLHDEVFDIVGPTGNVLKTVKSVEEVLTTLEVPTVNALIPSGTVVVRCQLDASGLPTGDAADLSTKLGSVTGVRRVRWERDPQAIVTKK